MATARQRGDIRMVGAVKVLVACEFSGAVRDAFIASGHDAVSCDLEPCDTPGPHYKGDVMDIINDGWDMMIAFPPCTHLCVSGAKHFDQKRKDGRQQQGIDFFMSLANAPINRIAIENPVGIISSVWRPPDQIIQPWQFGDPHTKTTCLWLKGMPMLKPTQIVGKGNRIYTPSGKSVPEWYTRTGAVPRAKARSKTFPGIAQAMAAQWGVRQPYYQQTDLFGVSP